MVQLVYFSEKRIELQRELQYHPELVEKLQRYAADAFELQLSEICSWFGIVLDGDYYPEDLDNLCEILRKKLVEKRTLILLQ